MKGRNDLYYSVDFVFFVCSAVMIGAIMPEGTTEEYVDIPRMLFELFEHEFWTCVETNYSNYTGNYPSVNLQQVLKECSKVVHLMPSAKVIMEQM